MESLNIDNKVQIHSQILKSISDQKDQSKIQAPAGDDDSVSIDMSEVYKSLTVLGDTIVKKLDEILKPELPNGIASLDPRQFTPENTAQRIVDGVTALFGTYEKQHSKGTGNEEDVEVLKKYMSAVRQGIQKGYEQAASILGDLGAFEFDGVKSGIEETMRLVEEKLKAFEESKMKKNDGGQSMQESVENKKTEAPAAN